MAGDDDDGGGDDDDDEGEAARERHTPRRSMDWVRCVCSSSRAGMWMGDEGSTEMVCAGSVRSCRWSVYMPLSVSPAVLSLHIERRRAEKLPTSGRRAGSERGSTTHPLDDAGADARQRALDLLVVPRAHDERAPRVDGRQQRVAVLEPVLELAARIERLARDPGQLARPRLGHPRGELRRRDGRPDGDGHGFFPVGVVVVGVGVGVAADGADAAAGDDAAYPPSASALRFSLFFAKALSPACAGVCLRVLYIRGGLACVFPLPRPGMELVCLRVRVFG